MARALSFLVAVVMVVFSTTATYAAESTVALGEVAAPAASTGIDRATLKNAAERELSGIDSAKLKAKKRRPVVVSIALTSATDVSKGCTVDAMLRDARSGAMIAIVQGRASAEGDGEGSPTLRKAVLHAAMRSAVTQIPDALSAD